MVLPAAVAAFNNRDSTSRSKTSTSCSTSTGSTSAGSGSSINSDSISNYRTELVPGQSLPPQSLLSRYLKFSYRAEISTNNYFCNRRVAPIHGKRVLPYLSLDRTIFLLRAASL
jgi:hypothetical protein